MKPFARNLNLKQGLGRKAGTVERRFPGISDRGLNNHDIPRQLR